MMHLGMILVTVRNNKSQSADRYNPCAGQCFWVCVHETSTSCECREGVLDLHSLRFFFNSVIIFVKTNI